VTELHRNGTTIILTTHYLFEADAMCQRIGVIDHGRLVALGTPSELKANVADLGVVELEVFGVDAGSIERLRGLEFVDSVVVEQRELRQLVRVQTQLAEQAVAPLVAALGGAQIGRVAVREATLEDAYVRLVGRVE
jgi:ABC-2 type transport system ATP-binding protein